MTLSVIIPVLDEESGIADALAALAPLRARGAEVIVVDGGSRDRTIELARLQSDHVILAARGRAMQMNAGAAAARGDVLMFLHCDTRLPDDADRLIVCGLARHRRSWGRFDICIAGRRKLLALVAWTMNLRSRLTGIATGDQAMFVTREAFFATGGFAEITLMEDVDISRRLKPLSRPLCLHACAITSGRRWEKHGVLRTILLMWRLRLAFFFGADPDRLAQAYGYGAEQS